MASIIEFNGKKYDSRTGRVLSYAPAVRPEPKSFDVIGSGKKIEVKSQAKPHKITREHDIRRHKVEKSKTLMRSSVRRRRHKPASEHKPAARVGLYQELRRERARRARHIQKSSAVTKFSKSEAKRRADITFTAKPLPVAAMPAPLREISAHNIANQVEQLAGKLEDAVQSAESHLEVFAGSKIKSRKSRKLAYALASFTSIALIGFAVYQAIPFVQVKMAGNKAGFAATLPGYAPSGYSLEKDLKTDSGIVTMNYSSGADNKNYQITQMPSQWNSDSLLNNYVLPAGSDYERIDQNGRIVYLYDDKKSATWLDDGIWYRLDGANNFSSDQLLRIVQGL